MKADDAQVQLLERCILAEVRAPVVGHDAASTSRPRGAPPTPHTPAAQQGDERIAPAPNATSLATWYRSVSSVERSAYRGWAVLDRDGRRVNGQALEWRAACKLADRVGGRVAMWTTRASHGR